MSASVATGLCTNVQRVDRQAGPSPELGFQLEAHDYLHVLASALTVKRAYPCPKSARCRAGVSN